MSFSSTRADRRNSIGTYTRTPTRLGAFLTSGLLRPAAKRRRLAFRYRTTLDATLVGGSANEPLVVTYGFEPTLSPGSGPLGNTSPFLSSYGPVEFIIEIGGDTVTASGPGTGITVFSNLSAEGVDQYELRAPYCTGKLFGFHVGFFRVLLVDQDAATFPTTDLPLTPAFADAIDFSQVNLQLIDTIVGHTDLGFSESSTTPVSERKGITLRSSHF